MAVPPAAHVKCAVTAPLFHPFAFGAGLSATVIVGGAVFTTIVKGALVTVAVLPARSAVVPATV